MRSHHFLPALGIVLMLCAALPAAPPPTDDALTENAAAFWDADAQSASASVADDTSRVKVGATSLRFDTTGGFDAWLWTPPLQDAGWDLSNVSRLQFWVYAINNNLGFQNHSPWIHLGNDTANYWRFEPAYDLLNDARNTWVWIDIPLAGDSFWQRSTVGTVDPTQINFLEIHADTWDAGFSLWFDGLNFDATPGLPDSLRAIAGDARVDLNWKPYAPGIGFSHFAVYRATSPFTTVDGMTPIATVANAAATTYADTSAVNGVRYHYAITAVASGGAEESTVESIGPRTPRHETDLHVLYIGRTPRYPRYAPSYTYYTVTEPNGFGPYIFSAATGLQQGQTAGTQRFPDIGSTVTYTGHLRNRGTTTIAGPIQVSWHYDGAPIASTSVPGPLAPNQMASTSITRTWDGQSHDISFTIDTPDDRPENNALTDDTNAVGFLSFVDRTYEENRREETPNYPQATSDDFIYWLHLHIAEMNRLFEQAGSAKRVRFDRLEVLNDDDPDPPAATINYAIFPFRYRAGDGSLRFSGYYHPDVDIDYGLLHEKAHQLGLIDLYRINLPGDNNAVSGQGYSAIPGLMNGCSDFFSNHSALAMNHWYDVAHGYYGQYLYSMPDTVRMRFLTPDGAPLVGATVKMYQKANRPGLGEVITSQVKAQGVTDANGEWELPNIPVDPVMVPTTYAGDTLKDNPFGYLAVVGENSLLHFRVEKNGGVDFAWLDITEVNVAYWQGQTDVATFERQVGVGGPVQFVPPADLAELNAEDWSAWAQGSDAVGTYVVDETSAEFHPAGAGSIKFVTDGGFDTALRYPRGITAQWNLSRSATLEISLRTENSSSFQSGSPWIRLLDAENNYFEYRYYLGGGITEKLNETRGQWRSYSIPLDAPTNPGTGWGRSAVGTPDLAHIQYIEIHADTWGAGFTLWADGIGFDPTPYCLGDANDDGYIALDDFAALQECYTGLGVCAASGCARFDVDDDCDVDADDLADFVDHVTGTTELMPTCR